ncbi:TetR/AcrR family transcriptional regulator [Tumebacillus lipolyticus]|uniref:TetR/AcrR family transcriptional regulator n=1 Tax=Tumebacillus lipolyticus TaxID=1280370 RepID=A0ABW4ZVZ9_9BACL
MKSVDKRQAILEAAAKRFSRDGFHETKVGEIAEDAGIAKGTVYLHFKDKESLLAEVVRYQMSSYHKHIKEQMAPYESAADKLRAFASHKVTEFPRMVKFYKLNFAHMLKFKANESFEQEMKAEHGVLFNFLVDVIQQGIDRGEFREMNATDAALIITGTMQAYMHTAMSGVVEEKNSEDAEALINLAIRGFAR